MVIQVVVSLEINALFLSYSSTKTKKKVYVQHIKIENNCDLVYLPLFVCMGYFCKKTFLLICAIFFPHILLLQLNQWPYMDHLGVVVAKVTYFLAGKESLWFSILHNLLKINPSVLIFCLHLLWYDKMFQNLLFRLNLIEQTHSHTFCMWQCCSILILGSPMQ